MSVFVGLAVVAAFLIPPGVVSAVPADPVLSPGTCAGMTFLEDGSCTVGPGETVEFVVVSADGGPGGDGGDGGVGGAGLAPAPDPCMYNPMMPGCPGYDPCMYDPQVCGSAVRPSSVSGSAGGLGGAGGAGGRAYVVQGSFTNTTTAVVTLFVRVGTHGLPGPAGENGTAGTDAIGEGLRGGDGTAGEPGGDGGVSAILLDDPSEPTSFVLGAYVVVVAGGRGGAGGAGGLGGFGGVQQLNGQNLDGDAGSAGVDGSITAPAQVPAGWVHGLAGPSSTPLVSFAVPVVVPAYTG